MPFDFTAHPNLQALRERAAAAGAEQTTLLAGYLGGVAEGKVRLHSALDQPSEFLEIPQADILYLADAPEAVLPGGGKLLWVRAEVQVAYRRIAPEALEARFLAGRIGEDNLGPPEPAGHEMIRLTTTSVFHHPSHFCFRATGRCLP